jgi:hypothetical protein
MKEVFTHMLIPKESVGFLPGLGGICLFLCTSFLVYAQERAVPGESGQSLTVLVKITSVDATTNAGGKHPTCLS